MEGWAISALSRARRASFRVTEPTHLTCGIRRPAPQDSEETFIAPQSEWPQTTISRTRSADAALLDGGRNIVTTAEPGRHVAGVPANEEIARTALRNPLQRHAGVRACDKKRFGLLAGSKASE